MKKPPLKTMAFALILVTTLTLFVVYLRRHPSYLTQLTHIRPIWLVGIVAANFATIIFLTALSQVLIKIAGKQLAPTENFLLTIYSSIANFFGPLQSGPGVRAAYLKTKLKLPLRRYFILTLLAYAVFAVVSAFCLLVGTRPWWQTLLATGGAGLVSYIVIQLATTRSRGDLQTFLFTRKLLISLVALTIFQVLCIALRYYCTLRATGAEVSLGQALSYAGAANFALFVSITPDGIGIREGFLLFSQQVHQVSTQHIVQANIIDRASYVLFLGLLFIIALSLHAKKRFTAHQPAVEPRERAPQ